MPFIDKMWLRAVGSTRQWCIQYTIYVNNSIETNETAAVVIPTVNWFRFYGDVRLPPATSVDSQWEEKQSTHIEYSEKKRGVVWLNPLHFLFILLSVCDKRTQHSIHTHSANITDCSQLNSTFFVNKTQLKFNWYCSLIEIWQLFYTAMTCITLLKETLPPKTIIQWQTKKNEHQ